MMLRNLLRMATALTLAGLMAPARAELYINEIFFDPGNATNDLRDEFIELRGPADFQLDDHYLIFLENELDESNQGDAGVIEHIFDLNGVQIGGNGFLTFRQKFNRYSGDQVVSGANHLVNNGPNKPGSGTNRFPGYGNNDYTDAEGTDFDNEGSTIGSSDQVTIGTAPTTGALENSGFTAMLIHNDSGLPPVINDNLDVDNNGLDVPTGKVGWTILDSIGVFGEADESEFGRLYGAVNFASDDGFLPLDYVPNVPAGSSFAVLDHEIEYLARWGNSTGQTVDDWHASNLTDNAGTGAAGVIDPNVGPVDIRQAGDPHPTDPGENSPATQPAIIETNKGVPYGTKLLTNIGGPNYRTGDYNDDGVVDAADYTTWRDTEGVSGWTQANHPQADHNHDFVIDDLDYGIWVANFGEPSSPSISQALTTPEPSAALAAVIGMTCVSLTRRVV